MEQRTIAGRYELVEPAGSGWRAVDAELGRDVVVRLLGPGEPSPATAAATLAHPNVVRVFDQGEADGERFVVLEYLPGGSLEERLPRLGEREAWAVAADVAAALAYAHGQGVTHGSLSAASVLFDGEGRGKVAGFGAGGEPEDDVRAFGRILQSLATAAPALAPLAAAALAGELDSAELLERLGDTEPAGAAEETTLIQPPLPVARRRPGVLVLAVALALLSAGVGAAFLVTPRDSTAEDPGRSIPAPTNTSEPTSTAPAAPPTTETAETTTEQTTTAATEPEPTTAPTTQPPPPSMAPPPTTEPPPPTTTEEPPTTTEEPPTTTEEPPPTTTEQTTTAETEPG